VSEQVAYIAETKFASVKAVGLLSHTTTFVQFVDRVEASGGQQGSTFVEPAYAKLASSLFQWLTELGESEETRLAVRYENFQFLHAQLAARRISNLQTWCDRSKTIYEESLQGYVRMLIGKRFHAVMDFFEGVDKLYKSVPAENIQFQHTHSNQVIGKLLQKFKLDTVEEGLWKEFRRIKRDITADPQYAIDVWKTVKNYFLGKIKHFQEIVQECYRQQKFPFTSLDIEVKYKSIEERWEAKMAKKKGGRSSKSKDPNATSSKLSQTDDPSETDDITEFDDISELDTSD